MKLVGLERHPQGKSVASDLGLHCLPSHVSQKLRNITVLNGLNFFMTKHILEHCKSITCFIVFTTTEVQTYPGKLGRVKRIWYLSPMRAAKVQASLRIHAVSPEPSLLSHTSSESRGTFRQKARSLASLNGWACAVKICHDGMLEDTNSGLN